MGEPAAVRYCQIHFDIRNYKEEIKYTALGVLTWLMIHFLQYVCDCIWTGFAQPLCAMAACEAILRGFSTHWPAQEAGMFVCSCHVF